jgi:DMSO/TMAO reductase YedYZ molybdopterin-dependent catalytic subunit
MTNPDFIDEHVQVTRRHFVGLGGAAVTAWNLSALAVGDAAIDPLLREAVSKLEYLTPPDRIGAVLDKGKAGVAKLSAEELREAGLVPETWSLDVVPDPASNCVVEQPLSRALGNALDWNGLMKMAEKKVIRFMQVCSCTNGPDPFHMSLWEGVPLREVIWLTRPTSNVRRVYYQSYHPADLPPFQSSLPLGQILENPPGQMPVILAYKRNGQVIPASQGGPVRMIVPGAYGSKCIKWIQRVVMTNEFKANDSDADLNNDPENALKTRARFISVPKETPDGKPFALTGMAQVGVSGLSKVQYCVRSQQDAWPSDDPYLSRVGWKDCTILPPPGDWGGGLPDGRLPATAQTDPATGRPLQWPLRYAIVHWAELVPGLAPGTYELCCRTTDDNGVAQPMPRTLPRTGFNEIQRATVIVK